MANRFEDFLKIYEEEFKSAGEKLDKEKMPQLTEELFAKYELTGDRLEYEEVYFGRRKFLSVYAMLAIMHGEAKDISRLEEVIGAICDEECWALPAHVNRNETNWQITIDLFAAETAFSLAEITKLLEKKLSKTVCERAQAEVFRRVLNPFMDSQMPYAWWETSNMNWCAVCCGSVGIAAIWLMQREPQKLHKLLDRLNSSIMNYIRGFSEDGACLEGLGYYTYGMSFFVAYADMVYKYSAGRVNLFDNDKLKNIALFQQKCFLSENISLSFSDSSKDEKYRVGLTAYLSKRYVGVKFPSDSHMAGLESDNCYRYGILSRDYFWTKQYTNVEKMESEWHTVLPIAQWSICRSYNNCAMAAKGGHNDEPHNHNDVGSFVYACDGELVLDDLGMGEYNKNYFGETRYENICCRSLGHNVPIIEGREQYAGAEYKAASFSANSEGYTEMDIAAAYGLAKNEKIIRKITFERGNGKCIVVDKFVLNNDNTITENLVTSHKPKINENGFVISTRKNKFEIIVENGSGYEIVEQTYIDHYGVKKMVWLMQWKVVGDETSIAINKK